MARCGGSLRLLPHRATRLFHRILDLRRLRHTDLPVVVFPLAGGRARLRRERLDDLYYRHDLEILGRYLQDLLGQRARLESAARELIVDNDDRANQRTHSMSKIYVHLVWAAICAIALVVGIAFERHEGAQGCIQRDTQAGVAQEKKTAAAEGAGAVTATDEGKDYASRSTAPIVNAPAAIVCPPAVAPAASQMLPARAARPAAKAGS